MDARHDWEAVEKAIESHNKITLTTHVNPDGDGIGSELALYYHLKDMGKKDVRIINTSPTPEIYHFLDPDQSRITVYSEAEDEWIAESDLVFVLDIGNMDRLSKMSSVVKNSTAMKICIDHHHANNGLGEINIIDENACATSEMIFDFIKRSVRGKFELPMAEALYIAILTDTGSFRFSNSTPKAHMVAAELIAMGVNPRSVYEHVYESDSWRKVKLLGRVLDRVQPHRSGKIAWTAITNDIMQEIGAKQEDIEGFVEFLATIKGVEITILFLELPSGKVKASVRSKGKYDINKIASQFGGGGHIHASGILFSEAKLEDVTNRVVEACEKIL